MKSGIFSSTSSIVITILLVIIAITDLVIYIRARLNIIKAPPLIQPEDTHIATITDKLTNFEAQLEFGTVTGQLDTFNSDALFTAKRYLTVYLLARGSAAFEIKRNPAEVKINGQLIPTEKPETRAAPLPAPSDAGPSGEAEAPPARKPFVHIGDKVYYRDWMGRTRARVAGPKDATLPGDTVFVKDKRGQIQPIQFTEA